MEGSLLGTVTHDRRVTSHHKTQCVNWGKLLGRVACLSVRPTVEITKQTKPLGMSLWVSHAASKISKRWCRKKLAVPYCPVGTIYGTMSLASFNISQVFSILQGSTQIFHFSNQSHDAFWWPRRNFFNYFFPSYLQDHG